MNHPFLSKTRWRWIFLLAMVATIPIVMVAVKYWQPLWAERQKTEQQLPQAKSTPKIVTALGRLVPQGNVIKLSASPSVEGVRLAELLVEEGDIVEAADLIAILDNHDRLQVALARSRQQLKVAQSRLAQVKAGAKSGEIEAQKAAIARIEAERSNDIAAQTAIVSRLEAELKNAQIEYERYQQLYNQGAISASQRDNKALILETATEQLTEAQANLNRIRIAQQQEIAEAKATLEQIREVRPVDVQVAQAEVDEAMTAVQEAQVNLELAFVRSPQPGQVLKIQVRPGEIVGDEGIVEIGHTGQMEVIAEVYQTDVSRIQLGQKATITSSVFVGKLQGKVTRIGSQILSQNIFAQESGADVDRRIVEVRIRLDREGSRKVQNLTNLQVQVAIEGDR